MNQSNNNLTREEFIKQIFTKIAPFVLFIAAIIIALSIYISSDSLNNTYKIVLMIFVIILFGYPILKIYFGDKALKSFPPAFEPLLIIIRIIWTLVIIGILIFLSLNMPLLLILFFISLLTENNKFQKRVIKLERKLDQQSKSPKR